MSSFGGPRLILTVPGGSSRPNKTSSVKKSKFSKLSLMPFCQITADFTSVFPRANRSKFISIVIGPLHIWNQGQNSPRTSEN